MGQGPEGRGSWSECPGPGRALRAFPDADLPAGVGLKGATEDLSHQEGLGGDQSEPLAPSSETGVFCSDPGPCSLKAPLCNEGKEERGEAP